MRVKFFATYGKVTGCREITVPAPGNVGELLRGLQERWPDFKPPLLTPDGSALHPDAIMMVNGRHIQHLNGLETPLEEGDSVALTPKMAGG